MEATNIVYYGGTVSKDSIHALRRILFRSTRGRAIVNSFDLIVKEADILQGDTYHLDRTGYTVMVEDNAIIRRVVERVCQSFKVDETDKVFECSPKVV